MCRPEEYIPAAKYREFDKALSSVSTIMEKGTCKTVYWKNIEYVPTGAMGSGYGLDWQCIWAYEVVELSIYSGILKPLEYSTHNEDIRAGNRERGYGGMLVRCGVRQLVIVGQEITFRKLDVGKQLRLF